MFLWVINVCIWYTCYKLLNLSQCYNMLHARAYASRVSQNFPSVGYPKLFLLMKVWGYVRWDFHKNRREILKIHCAPHTSIIQRKSRKNTKEKFEIRILKFLALKRSFKDIWHSWLHSWGANASFDTHIDIQSYGYVIVPNMSFWS